MSGEPGRQRFRVDRLWPDPARDLDLDEAFADLALPESMTGRPWVATNMVTSLDGRAQLGGTAEGLSGRADRRLMRLYRTGFDAVGSGAGTLRRTDFWSTVPPDLAERRVADGRPPQPIAVLIAGRAPVPSDRRWFGWEQPRLLVVGASSPHALAGAQPPPAGTDLIVAPTDRPEPAWVLAQLVARGIGSLLLEGGPTTNAAFLAAGCLDELYWTLGARVLATDALPMIAPLADSPFAVTPREAGLVSVHRSEDELFLRYRFD
ncbi:MAG: dihydrofolate reductase family protein [Chloroflexota bacterium]|nr:dihydrofolate reductase family protein [Chloroflexota bacterium]